MLAPGGSREAGGTLGGQSHQPAAAPRRHRRKGAGLGRPADRCSRASPKPALRLSRPSTRLAAFTAGPGLLLSSLLCNQAGSSRPPPRGVLPTGLGRAGVYGTCIRPSPGPQPGSSLRNRSQTIPANLTELPCGLRLNPLSDREQKIQGLNPTFGP